MLDGSLQSVLDGENISDALLSVGSQHIQKKCGDAKPDMLVLLHDPCDIRKEYAEELEHLGTVRSLDGKLMPGYQTFNTVVVTEQGTSPQPLNTTVYSNGDPHYVTEEELKRYHKVKLRQSEPEQEQERQRHEDIERFLSEESVVNLKSVFQQQVAQVNQQMQGLFPGVSRCHVFDRQFDGVPYFDFIGLKLEDWFVIRVKGSRNSNTMQREEATGKQKAIKLKDDVGNG